MRSLTRMKLTMFRISNGARMGDGTLPKELALLTWGNNPAIKGLNPKVGNHTVAKFNAAMREAGLDRVALDFEHNTVPGSPAYKESVEPRAVAGFGVPVLRPGSGLFLTDMLYTPHGASHALDFIDLSPTVHIDPTTGEIDFLHSVALTRAGAVEGLSFYSVEANIEARGDKPTQGDDEMDWKVFLTTFSGASAEATDEELQKAFVAALTALCASAVEAAKAELKTELATLSATVTALKPAGEAGETGVEAELTALSGSLALVKDELTTLRAENVKRDRLAICSQAAREGKVIPLSAAQIEATDVNTLSEMVGKLPVTVPLHARTPENIKALSAATASATLSKVSQLCGQDAAKVLEANK